MSPISPSLLSSPRLFLRRLQPDDRDVLCSYRSLPEVARYQGWESFGPAHAQRLIESQDNAELGIPGTWFQVAVVKQATNVMIGDCELHSLQDEQHQIEFGITFAPSYQGQGYAKLASQLERPGREGACAPQSMQCSFSQIVMPRSIDALHVLLLMSSLASRSNGKLAIPMTC